MPTKATLSEAEYLRISFPGVDQEFLEGELVERGTPDLFHSDTEFRACAAFRERESSLHLYAFPELRLRIRPGRVIIPDVCVFHPTHPTEPVPSTTPFIVIEIISPDDRISEVRKKLQEYVDWGVPHVWLIDPRLRRLYLCTDGLHEVPTYSIPELSLTIPPAMLFR